ncbi:MAG: transcription termination factor NusA [Bacillota bacterium]
MSEDLIKALDDLEREKGIDKEVLIQAIEAALISAYKRNFGTAQNVRIRMDRESGEVKVFSRRTVVEQVKDPRTEISLDEARKMSPAYKPGDVVETEVTPRNFGRIAAQTAKQVVLQRIREAERGVIYEEFSSKEGDIVTGTVQRADSKNVVVDLGRLEALLPPNEQIPSEKLEHGDRIKVYILEVKRTTKGPQVSISRTHPGLLKRLLELEVPEVHEGIVEIKGIVREPGTRSKVAVRARDPNVDPVGAVVGPKGLRIQNIVNELRGEKIDVVRWDEQPEKFIANALSPAKVISVTCDPVTRVARVVVPDNQLSLSIGKEGQNARLAAKLTGWKVDIRSESQVVRESEEAGLGKQV